MAARAMRENFMIEGSECKLRMRVVVLLVWQNLDGFLLPFILRSRRFVRPSDHIFRHRQAHVRCGKRIVRLEFMLVSG